LIGRREKLAVSMLVVFAYVLSVPIIPFQVFYNVDPNDSSASGKVWLLAHFYFDAFIRPAGIPMASANFGVWGQQSVSAYFFNFGVVSNSVCAFNPSSDTANGLGLFPLTLPITILVALGLAYLFAEPHENHPARKQES
jgi:hypothetical protein